MSFRRSRRTITAVSGTNLVLATLIVHAFATRPAVSGEPVSRPGPIESRAVDDWIEALDHDSYHVRLSAERFLLGGRNDPLVESKVIDALRHDSIEVRARALSILMQFRLDAFDEQVDRLADSKYAADEISLPGWQRFVEAAGADRAARAVFQKMVNRFGGTLQSIDQNQVPNNFGRDFDPYRVGENEPLRWAVLLICDTEGTHHGVGDLSYRIINALCNSGLGPRCQSGDEELVVRRLINHWISTHRGVATPREHLLAAMRFQCRDQAEKLCREVLADLNATPSSQTTAMLVANVLVTTAADAAVSSQNQIESELRRRLDDDRTAHVWQLIASRKTKIRTQIGDVALALLLHRNGHDPRDMGFKELQADPLLVFRDHSLGFPDEVARRDAQDRAHVVLGQIRKSQ